MAKYPFRQFVVEQFASLPIINADLTGRTIIVVGANVGLGLEASRHLAKMNPGKLILACRNVEKGERARKDIESTTGCKTTEIWQIDLASFSSVSAFVDRFQSEGGGKLDLLIQNAGMATFNFSPTVDKYERTLQVNHLSTTLLAILMLPFLSKSNVTNPGPRIVIVASSTHFQIPSLVEAQKEHVIGALNDPSLANMHQRYDETKLLNVFLTRAMAQHLSANDVVVDSVNPGLCHSELTREATGAVKVIFTIFKTLLARSTEKGSRTIIHAALGENQSKVQGKYLNKCEIHEESDYVISDEGRKVQDRIWKETMVILVEVDKRVAGIAEKYLAN